MSDEETKVSSQLRMQPKPSELPLQQKSSELPLQPKPSELPLQPKPSSEHAEYESINPTKAQQQSSRNIIRPIDLPGYRRY